MMPPAVALRVAISFALLGVRALASESQECAVCHADIYRRYVATPMARTSGIAGAGSPRESLARAAFDAPGGVRYEVSGSSGRLQFTFSSGDVRGQRSLDYFVGAGVVGRSYVSSLDGFLFQAPVSYYSRPAAWGLSPGFEHGESINLTREVEPACLKCHATGLQTVPGTSNGYAQPPFREAGVGCERCHGLGDEHIAGMRRRKSNATTAIVNPAKLDGWRRESVCAQCHLPGAVEIAKDGSSPYRPGDLLNDSVSVLVWSGATRETTVNGHFEQLMRSACRRASGQKLWCGTCHDPHGETDYRKTCLTCHTTASCNASASLRADAADQCTSCHMPRTAAATVQHAAYADHSIPRLPRPAAPLRIAADSPLIPFEGFTAGPREMGLAYATVAIQDSNRTLGMRAFNLLRNTNGTHPDDMKVASKLAELYNLMGNESQACDLYARIANSGETALAAAVNYGTCLAKEGKLDRAIAMWSGVVRTNPANESARLNLAVAQFRSGMPDEARSNLNEILRFNPASGRARELLREMRP